MSKILLIDDNPEKRNALKVSLENQFSGSGIEIEAIENTQVESYLPENTSADENENNSLEERFFNYLKNHPDIKLVIVDHDLSQFDKGLSESVIAFACKAASVPHCRYSRKPKTTTDRQKFIELLEKERMHSILVNIRDIEGNAFSVPDEDTKKIKCIYDGFEEITTEINKFDFESLKQGPSHTLAKILGEPGLSPFFEKYLSGYSPYDETSFIHVFNSEISPQEKENQIKKRLSYALGFWLYNVILKFPGLILHKTAAASYLNMNKTDFDEHKSFFESTLYSGPFSQECGHEYWWRPKLDDLLIDADVNDGPQYLEKNDVTGISQQFEDSGQPFGYYCLITEKPIKFEDSLGGLSWIPKGADLSRVNKETYDGVAPLLGLEWG